MSNNIENMKRILALLLFIVLNACSGITTSHPSAITSQIPETQPIETRTLTSSTDLLQRSPTITSTPKRSVTPTASRRPSYTPTLRRPTKTWLENIQATRTAETPLPTNTPIANFPVICGQYFYQYDTSISPDGNWLAISCGHESNQTLEIASKDGKRWTLYFKDYLSAEKIDQYGTAGIFNPVHWTIDEAYLYFTENSPFDGGGSACFYGPRIIDLYRINLNTGMVSAILTGTYHFAFSPGGLWLAYIANRPIILNLRTGEKLTIEVGNVELRNPSVVAGWL